MEDLSNKSVTRFIGAEVLLSILATTFMIGVTWSSLAKDVSEVETKVVKQETKQERTTSDVQSIRIDLAVMKANQEVQSEKQKEQGADIKKILDILQDSPE